MRAQPLEHIQYALFATINTWRLGEPTTIISNGWASHHPILAYYVNLRIGGSRSSRGGSRVAASGAPGTQMVGVINVSLLFTL